MPSPSATLFPPAHDIGGDALHRNLIMPLLLRVSSMALTIPARLKMLFFD